jgi:hypothetical protein
MFDFHPNKPKWYKYLMHKARKKKKKIFKFSAVTKSRKVHLGFQRGLIWNFKKVSFKFSTEFRLIFDFYPNEPKWDKYMMF